VQHGGSPAVAAMAPEPLTSLTFHADAPSGRQSPIPKTQIASTRYARRPPALLSCRPRSGSKLNGPTTPIACHVCSGKIGPAGRGPRKISSPLRTAAVFWNSGAHRARSKRSPPTRLRPEGLRSLYGRLPAACTLSYLSLFRRRSGRCQHTRNAQCAGLKLRLRAIASGELSPASLHEGRGYTPTGEKIS
jgi:hypothetical protein